MTTTRAGVGRRGVQLPPSEAAAAAAAAEVGSPRSPQRGGLSGRKVEHREFGGLMDLLGGVILLFVKKSDFFRWRKWAWLHHVGCCLSTYVHESIVCTSEWFAKIRRPGRSTVERLNYYSHVGKTLLF